MGRLSDSHRRWACTLRCVLWTLGTWNKSGRLPRHQWQPKYWRPRPTAWQIESQLSTTRAPYSSVCLVQCRTCLCQFYADYLNDKLVTGELFWVGYSTLSLTKIYKYQRLNTLANSVAIDTTRDSTCSCFYLAHSIRLPERNGKLTARPTEPQQSFDLKLIESFSITKSLNGWKVRLLKIHSAAPTTTSFLMTRRKNSYELPQRTSSPHQPSRKRWKKLKNGAHSGLVNCFT